jgi:hypothetical protein
VSEYERRDGGGTVAPEFAVTSTTQVEIDGLDTMRGLLGRELDTNLRPGLHRICSDHDRGVGFAPATQSAQVDQTQYDYSLALAAATENLHTYVTFAQVLIDAIYTVIERYGNTEASADQMMRLLQDRIAAGQAARDPYLWPV